MFKTLENRKIMELCNWTSKTEFVIPAKFELLLLGKFESLFFCSQIKCYSHKLVYPTPPLPLPQASSAFSSRVNW